jgi:formamidopyrimidine-DNA glycosylase
MPELPEVETTRRGIAPHLEGQRLTGAVVRQPRLRYPVTEQLGAAVRGKTLVRTGRRGKYLLLETDSGTLLVHLGMSGSLRVLPANTPPGPHDHVDLLFGDSCLRLRDPRRFGLVLWTTDPPLQHPLLAKLGPEPLSPDFSAGYLHQAGRHRRTAVKQLIMDSHVVVGVGNIYASEALFRAHILPARQAGRISLTRYALLVDAIRDVLARAIEHGGTTLRDFVREDGNPGYFRNELMVYGRTSEPCPHCGAPVRQRVLGQRSTYYCGRCQR